VNQRDPKRSILRTDISDFKKGTSWGYNKFISSKQLAQDGFLVLDSLHFRFNATPTNPQTLSEDHSRLNFEATLFSQPHGQWQ